MSLVRRLAADRSAAAAAEMALVLPIFIALVFGTVELGHYFMSEHIVQKSVRDAARYAARLPIGNYPDCTAPVAAATSNIQNVAKTGDPDGDVDNDGTPDQRLQGWTSAGMATVSVVCNNSGFYKGVYSDLPGGTAKVVTVTAAVPYPTLFGTLGVGNAARSRCAAGQPASWACLTLGARSQSAVFGA